MITIAEIENRLHSVYLSALNLHRFCQTQAFKRAFEIATHEEKVALSILINNQTELEFWTKTILKKNKDYDYLSVSYLKEIAQENSVPYYSKMVRLELIVALTKLNEKEKNNDKGIGSIVGGNGTVTNTVHQNQK